MLTRITYQDTMPNGEQITEVEGLGGPCAADHEAFYMDKGWEFRSLFGST